MPLAAVQGLRDGLSCRQTQVLHGHQPGQSLMALPPTHIEHAAPSQPRGDWKHLPFLSSLEVMGPGRGQEGPTSNPSLEPGSQGNTLASVQRPVAKPC